MQNRSGVDTVHVGIHYDIEVDTTKISPEECAGIIGQKINPSEPVKCL